MARRPRIQPPHQEKFDELNIEIPFPHRTIYFGKDKAGESPALNVEMNQTT